MSSLDVLTLPFDQYQRYAAAARVADLLRARLARPRLRVLDVGGFFRTASGQALVPLAHFLPHDHVLAVDRVPERVSPYAVADGCALPFPARAFDLVVSCDTLEHILPAARPVFVDELLRVAAGCLVLIAPFFSESTVRAEHLLHAYMAAHGVVHRQLEEHLLNGLPHAEDVRALLSQRGVPFFEFADGYLPRWLIMMVIKHSPGPSLDWQIDLDRWYNQALSPHDRREPAYRRALIVPLHDDPGLLPAVADLFSPSGPEPADLDLHLAFSLVQALLPSPGQPPAAGNLSDVYARLADLQAENRSLLGTLQAYERGRFIRFMRRLHRWRQGLRR